MSDDLSAVDVAATVVTVRVDTEGEMLARVARRVVLPASLLLNCENFSFSFEMMVSLRPESSAIGCIFANLFFRYSRGGFGRGRGAAPPS